jgi:hypothetical protein
VRKEAFADERFGYWRSKVTARPRRLSGTDSDKAEPLIWLAALTEALASANKGLLSRSEYGIGCIMQ